jgi:predicted SAM-dependent methyltransferase
MIIRLGVGDTAEKQEGFLNVDIRPLSNIDVVADAANLPFKDEEHDGIYTRNLVEHFGRHEIDAVLREWARVLKSGSILFIETVDAGRTMDVWRKIPTENWMDGILGAQTYPENFHKMAFTEELMIKKLADAGFNVTRFETVVHREIPRMKVWAEKI